MSSGFYRWWDLRCAPNFASFVGAGVDSPGYPESSPSSCRLAMSHRVSPLTASSGSCRGWIPGSPRSFVFPGSPTGGSSGCPDFRTFRRCQRWVAESPRSLVPLAAPAVGIRVASLPAPFSAPGDQVLGHPLAFDPPPHPLGDFPGCPVSSLLRLRRRWSYGFPLARIFRVCRLASSRWSESCLNGRSDDESRFLELCILWLSQRMNLRVDRY